MFVLSELEDTIAVHPNHFGMPTIQAVSDQINRKFANKILQDVGLCISLFDISSCSEGRVRWGDGLLYHKVTFRLIVFRPFTNQVLVGKIKSSDETGIRVTMGFFDDIYIPAPHIPAPSAFDHQERAFFWLFEARTPRLQRIRSSLRQRRECTWIRASSSGSASSRTSSTTPNPAHPPGPTRAGVHTSILIAAKLQRKTRGLTTLLPAPSRDKVLDSSHGGRAPNRLKR
ncbi:related to RPC25 - DNA-direcred RNA polymerase III, 25 KD subunit [Pseudozyma flocculosa]|uniref:Related to RPC25 - DNA-direcred RNA polymerase III, 25 KD subunit n=1 Tax=Pseudozyma flocculosa TaxID=84751 RepID=A0A5C3EUP2_9BASI|nr:related to RPC25 - DNA-direcred RNA polymerase III, 25 KD subunit [Pseudozyma flocculosa]